MATGTVRDGPVAPLTSGRERPVSEDRAAAATGTSRRRPWRFVKRLVEAAIADGITDVAAMMAYYAVLALFPMLLFVITVGLLVIDPDVIYQGVELATQAMPANVQAFVRQQAASMIDTAGAGFAIGAAALALWGASRGAAALGTALNVIFNREETRSWIVRQVTAVAVTLGVAVTVVAALGLLVIGPIAGGYVAELVGLGGVFDVLWAAGRWLGAGVLVMFVWAVVYKFLPSSGARFRVFTPGAFVGVLLWLGISWGFGLFLSRFGRYDATYGALASAIIFLTWLWLSNLALLFGAEINDVLAGLRREREARRDDPGASAHSA